MKIIISIIMFTFIFSHNIEKTFKIDGMTCGGCAQKVINAVASLDGVNTCDVNVDKGLAYISFENDIVTQSTILETLKSKTNYSCTIPQKKVKKGFFQKLFGLFLKNNINIYYSLYLFPFASIELF